MIHGSHFNQYLQFFSRMVGRKMHRNTCNNYCACYGSFLQAKTLAIEIYKWIRDILKQQLQNIKPVQVCNISDIYRSFFFCPGKKCILSFSVNVNYVKLYLVGFGGVPAFFLSSTGTFVCSRKISNHVQPSNYLREFVCIFNGFKRI